MKILHIDAENSGISGDMLLASLLGLVEQPETVLSGLLELKNYLGGVSKFDVKLISVENSGIQVKKLDITIKESKDHRTAVSLKSALNQYLEDKKFTENAKKYANNVLDSLVQAEAEIHGKLEEKIHLHELSSIDTLLDIIGVTSAFERLGFFQEDFHVSCSRLPLGKGTIKTAHGILPVPAPATLKILEQSTIEVFQGPIESELATPTGVALLKSLKPVSKPFHMKLDRVSYGTGEKNFNDFPNLLRLEFGHLDELVSEGSLSNHIEPVVILETDVDDLSGEILGNFITSIERDKILDVQVIPAVTKKNRPSQVVRILCQPADKEYIMRRMLLELGTLGVRFQEINRICVDREFISVNIEIGNQIHEIPFKISYITKLGKIEIVNVKPEFDRLKKIGENMGIPVKEVLLHAQAKIPEIIEAFKSKK